MRFCVRWEKWIMDDDFETQPNEIEAIVSSTSIVVVSLQILWLEIYECNFTSHLQLIWSHSAVENTVNGVCQY